MKNQKGFVAAIIIVVALLAIGGAYIYKNKKAEAPSKVDVEIPTSNKVEQLQVVSKPQEVIQKVVSIKVLSPIEGETWTLGDLQKMISWNYSDGLDGLNSVVAVNLITPDSSKSWDIFQSNLSKVTINLNENPRVGKIPWSALTLNSSLPSGQYKISIIVTDLKTKKSYAGTSALFNVKNPASVTPVTQTPPTKTVPPTSSTLPASSQTTPSPTIVGTSQTVNGIVIMKENVAKDFFLPQTNGGTYAFETNNILNNFYSNHADDYDFIAVLSPKPLASDWSLMVNQSGETMGPNLSTYPSTSKKLKSFVALDISAIDDVAKSGVSVADFEQGNMRTTLTSLAHEIAHHWIAFIPWEGMKSAHYSNMADLFSGSLSYSDPMGYHHWVDTAAGKVCVDNNSNSVTPKFSNLSLYLMGLVPKTSVQPIPVIQTSVTYPYGQPPCNEATNFVGTKTYTIDEIIALAGKDRVPAYPNTQKDFKVGYIIIVPANESLSSGSMQFATDIINQLPQFWANLTNNLSKLI